MKQALKVLVVEDQRQIAGAIQQYLEGVGYATCVAYDGHQALCAFFEEKPDLVLLDLMLPVTSGLDVAHAIRRESNVPIIMLTARSEERDRVAGLELGADDYIVKPFSLRELVARIRAVVRRTKGEIPFRLSIEGLTIDSERREVTTPHGLAPLTSTEFDLLTLLAAHPGKVFSRPQLLTHLRGFAPDASVRTIDVHIKNLRKKVEANPNQPSFVRTVQGIGYKFCDEGAR